MIIATIKQRQIKKYWKVLFQAYNLIIKRITRCAIIVEINTKDVKLVKTNISSFLDFYDTKENFNEPQFSKMSY